MIQADAHTNPLTYRSCTHVHPGIERPSRCLACGVVDHGPTTVGDQDPVLIAMRFGGMAAYGTGSYLYGDAEKPKEDLCPKGHALNIQRYITAKGEGQRRVCMTCREERRQVMLLEPCAKGHVGSRFYPKYDERRGIRCRVCFADKEQRYRAKKAASFTRARAEASHA
jgi:hypothetical protein